MQGPDVIRLLDAAKAVTKSDYATAKATGISTSNISDWRHGRRTMPACDVALVADVAGLDAVAWTARAVAQSHEGTKKGDALSAALKKALAATGAVLITAGLVPEGPGSYLIRCIKRKVLRLPTSNRKTPTKNLYRQAYSRLLRDASV